MRIFSIVRAPNGNSPIDHFASHERRLDGKAKVETRYLAATKQACMKAALGEASNAGKYGCGHVAVGGYSIDGVVNTHLSMSCTSPT